MNDIIQKLEWAKQTCGTHDRHGDNTETLAKSDLLTFEPRQVESANLIPPDSNLNEIEFAIAEAVQFINDNFEIYSKWKDEKNKDVEPKTKEQPYLDKNYIRYIRYKYNPKYGDNRICFCGHSYVRHFDSYEDMDPVGCKYCGCYKFVERTESNKYYKNVCRSCGEDTKDEDVMVCDKCSSEFEF